MNYKRQLTFSIITYGCTFNSSDSQKIEKILLDNGYINQDFNNSDIIIVNTCSVKHATETKIFSFIETSLNNSPDKFFIITGCLPQASKEYFMRLQKILGKKGFILHPHEISKLIYYLEKYMNFKEIPFCDSIQRDKSKLIPNIKPNQIIGIIQISEGCNNDCSYCSTKNSRGTLISFCDDSIIEQINILYKKGIKEFHITSQDIGNYRYNGQALHDLLLRISKISGTFFIRLGMLNPEYLVENIDDFIKIFNDKRIYRFLHIPIQSASNDILLKMKRKYSIEEVKNIIDFIKKFDPNFSFSTDIITGFPTESNEDHRKTINFIKKWKPLVLNISKYSVRPNTEAKKMPQLKSEIIKNRSQELTAIFSEYWQDEYKKWINWEGDIFLNEYKINSDLSYTGRNLYYLPILIDKGNLGEIKKVKIIECINHSFTGKII